MSRATTKFGDYSVHIDWQQRGSDFQFKTVKKDRKKVGELRKYSPTSSEYIIELQAYALSRGAFAVKHSTITLLRCLGCPDLKFVIGNGDSYKIKFADLVAGLYREADPKLAQYNFISFEKFEITKGEPESIEHSMKVGKWK